MTNSPAGGVAPRTGVKHAAHHPSHSSARAARPRGFIRGEIDPEDKDGPAYKAECDVCESVHGIVPGTGMCGGCVFGEAGAQREYDELVGL